MVEVEQDRRAATAVGRLHAVGQPAQHEAGEPALPRWKPETGSRPPVKYIEELIGLGQLGYIRAIQLKLDEIGSEYAEHADFVAQMRGLIDRFDLDQYMATLKALHSHDH